MVSFYELIDHTMLRHRLNDSVRNPELLDLLFKSLETWTLKESGAHLKHGVPQGPEASAFLAECFLFHFDETFFTNVKYLRYVDDIKLMAKDENSLLRALVRLDLEAKELGLVPQAQKIEVRKVESIDDAIKTIPSSLANGSYDSLQRRVTQKRLLDLFRRSIKRKDGITIVTDDTKFKFALFRLKPRRDVLKRIAPLLQSRPDLCWVLCTYLQKFTNDDQVAELLLNALDRTPLFDACASDLTAALCRFESNKDSQRNMRIVSTAHKRSEEKSIALRVAVLTYVGCRSSLKRTISLLRKEKDPFAKSLVIHRLFDSVNAPFRLEACAELLEDGVRDQDHDYARYCAELLLREGIVDLADVRNRWSSPNDAVWIVMKALGIRKRTPARITVLDQFFKKRQGVKTKIRWRRALGNRLTDIERKCLRFQRFLIGDATASILMLDTFNESLVQEFSSTHPTLRLAYARAANANLHPDYGNWLHNGDFSRALPTSAVGWLRAVHNARVKSDMAHAREKRTGKPTKPVSHRTADSLKKNADKAWEALFQEWEKVL